MWKQTNKRKIYLGAGRKASSSFRYLDTAIAIPFFNTWKERRVGHVITSTSCPRISASSERSAKMVKIYPPPPPSPQINVRLAIMHLAIMHEQQWLRGRGLPLKMNVDQKRWLTAATIFSNCFSSSTGDPPDACMRKWIIGDISFPTIFRPFIL